MLTGTLLSFSRGVKPTCPLQVGGITLEAYIGIHALAVNLVVAALATIALDRAGVARGADATETADYDAR